MNLKVTHTFAVLEVPAEVYGKIRELLVEAGYEHTFHNHLEGEVIDMQGIALKSEVATSTTSIHRRVADTVTCVACKGTTWNVQVFRPVDAAPQIVAEWCVACDGEDGAKRSVKT